MDINYLLELIIEIIKNLKLINAFFLTNKKCTLTKLKLVPHNPCYLIQKVQSSLTINHEF